MKSFLHTLRSGIILSVLMLVLCSIVYPGALTAVGGAIFPKQANGNLVTVKDADGNEVAVGSELVGQDFTDPRFFRGRVSSVNYNTYTEEDLIPDEEGNTSYGGVSSGSFNYGASNPDLQARVAEDLDAFVESHPGVNKEDIPADLLTASGSGLDPHISPASAELQVPYVAEASGLSEDEVRQIVADNTDHKVLGVFGEEKVNVLKCNIDIAEKLGMISK